MDTRKKLTKSAIDALQPSDREQCIWCAELPGFGVRVQPGGSKVYLLRYRTLVGAPRKQVLARTCDMPPEQARKLAREVLAKVAAGADPLAERRAAVPAPVDSSRTVEKLFQAYVANMRARSCESAVEVERALLLAKTNAADALGRHRPCGAVTRAEIIEHVASIFKAGHRGAADKQRSYIASAYTWGTKSANDYTVAERQDWGISQNPAIDIPRDKGATTARERALTAAELHRLWNDTAATEPGFAPETAACIRVLIATGQRVQEVLRMRGDMLDLKELVWRLPARVTKGRKLAHVVPLPTIIVPVLERMMAIHGGGLLFPGLDGGMMPHQSVMQAIERWYERRSVAPLQTRDIRRTWKTRANDAGVDRFTRDLIQQHVKGDTGSKVYDRSDYLPQMRDGMAKWDAWLTKVAAAPAQVIKISAA